MRNNGIEQQGIKRKITEAWRRTNRKSGKHTGRTEEYKEGNRVREKITTAGGCWGKTAEEWRKRGMGSRIEGYKEKGTVREKDWAADADRYRQKDSEMNKEIASWFRTKEKGEEGRRKDKDAGFSLLQLWHTPWWFLAIMAILWPAAWGLTQLHQRAFLFFLFLEGFRKKIYCAPFK